MHYQIMHLKDTSAPDTRHLLNFAQHELASSLSSSEQKIALFGVFTGLFGLATNELYAVLNSATAMTDPGDIVDTHQFVLMNTENMQPTVRPVHHETRSKAGIYVFRWFSVNNQDVDEIAALSKAAWVSFEEDEHIEVQGLFAQTDRNAPRGKMLLITQYDELADWQRSRTPATEAQDNFRRRHALTLEATPIATRLIPAA